MPKIRHIALAAKDPEATAAFYIKGFGFKETQRFGDFTGQTKGKSYGMYLTDGTLNLAIIRFGWSQGGKDLDFYGIHHIGVEVDDVGPYTEKLESLGAECLVRPPERPDKGEHIFYEVKFRAPDDVLIDIADKPWLGSKPAKAEKDS